MVQASLTGHLVMSTLHTNTAVGAITRLRDMGIEPFLISSSLLCTCSALSRTLCPDCKEPYQADEETKKLFSMTLEDSDFISGLWMESCNFKGYRGRTDS